MMRPILAWLILCALAPVSVTWAQQTPEEQLEGAVVASAGAQVKPQAATPISSSAIVPPPRPEAKPSAAVLPEMPKAPVRQPPRVKSSAPPSDLHVNSGQNAVFSIALFHVNRIVTPFRNPEIRTSSTATLSVEGGIIYVTTQVEDPIGLFVFDKRNPSRAISLTLNPSEISPVSVSLHLEGYIPSQDEVHIAGDRKKARHWEMEDPYVATIKAIFKDLAMNKIPEGYGMTMLNGRYRYMPHCGMAGVEILPMQLIEGGEVTAIVAKVTNNSFQAINIDEHSCKSDRLIGVAAWPYTTIQPGQATELYFAIQTPLNEGGGGTRPSVVSQGAW